MREDNNRPEDGHRSEEERNMHKTPEQRRREEERLEGLSPEERKREEQRIEQERRAEETVRSFSREVDNKNGELLAEQRVGQTVHKPE